MKSNIKIIFPCFNNSKFLHLNKLNYHHQVRFLDLDHQKDPLTQVNFCMELLEFQLSNSFIVTERNCLRMTQRDNYLDRKQLQIHQGQFSLIKRFIIFSEPNIFSGVQKQLFCRFSPVFPLQPSSSLQQNSCLDLLVCFSLFALDFFVKLLSDLLLLNLQPHQTVYRSSQAKFQPDLPLFQQIPHFYH